MKRAPTVFIVDDDAAVRDSIAMALGAFGVNAITYAGAEEFLCAYDPAWPGCLLLDVNMPGMSGIELQGELNRHAIRLPVLFLTGYGDIPMSVRAMQEGAMDFLTKPIQAEKLLEKVQQAFQRDACFRARADEAAERQKRLQTLTPRELDVMRLAVAGYSNKEIARHLNISFRTVEIHRSRVMTKCDVANLLELAKLAESCEIAADPLPD